jgi:hypothetical protein
MEPHARRTLCARAAQTPRTCRTRTTACCPRCAARAPSRCPSSGSTRRRLGRLPPPPPPPKAPPRRRLRAAGPGAGRRPPRRLCARRARCRAGGRWASISSRLCSLTAGSWRSRRRGPWHTPTQPRGCRLTSRWGRLAGGGVAWDGARAWAPRRRGAAAAAAGSRALPAYAPRWAGCVQAASSLASTLRTGGGTWLFPSQLVAACTSRPLPPDPGHSCRAGALDGGARDHQPPAGRRRRQRRREQPPAAGARCGHAERRDGQVRHASAPLPFPFSLLPPLRALVLSYATTARSDGGKRAPIQNLQQNRPLAAASLLPRPPAWRECLSYNLLFDQDAVRTPCLPGCPGPGRAGRRRPGAARAFSGN